MAKPKASTKKKRGKWIRRRIAAWADATGDDDAFLDAMVEVTEEAEARIDYSLVIRERSRDGYTGNALTIPVIDVEPAFQAHDDPLSLFPFRRFGHYNEQGNQIVADTILRVLSVP